MLKWIVTAALCAVALAALAFRIEEIEERLDAHRDFAFQTEQALYRLQGDVNAQRYRLEALNAACLQRDGGSR
jgi:hypothetical protein